MTGKHLKHVVILSIVAGVATCAGTAWWLIANANAETESAAKNGPAFVAGELLKASVSFVLIALGGALVKVSIDTTVDRERELRAQAQRDAERCHILAEQEDERRRTILGEFVAVYSEFYAVRKLYHSARSESNNIYDKRSDHFRALIQELLNRAVVLEGRYGAVKMLAITTFKLPSGFLEVKSVRDAQGKLEVATDPLLKMRLMLDLLGEAYDDWRHALEEGRRIELVEDVWATYDKLLLFLQTARMNSSLVAA